MQGVLLSQKRLKLSCEVDECKPLPAATGAALAPNSVSTPLITEIRSGDMPTRNAMTARMLKPASRVTVGLGFRV
jgi:hypothetical protein